MRQLIIITILVLVCSCKKESTISGRAYDLNSNEGISDVVVLVSEEKIDPVPDSWYGTGSKGFLAETDANGNYVLPIKRKKNKTYYIYFLYPDEYYYTIDSKRKEIKPEGGNQEINYALIPTASLKTSIKNENCFDVNDKIEVFTSDEFGNSLTNLEFNLSGCIDQTAADFLRTSSGEHYYHWIVTKNSVTTHHYDTITLAPYEEGYYQILY